MPVAEKQQLDALELCVERDQSASVREWMSGWTAALPSSLVQDVELLTHELVANAFRHSGTTRAWVTALLLPDSVLVQVADEGRSDEPHIRPLVPYAESGRGLRWVSALARSWGVHKRATTCVCFELEYPARVA